ncbi:MAG: hypothetical protein C0490_05930 [Marivirga sp.]|nr:hypothetical protein [Marivirga sp.]
MPVNGRFYWKTGSGRCENGLNTGVILLNEGYSLSGPRIFIPEHRIMVLLFFSPPVFSCGPI